MSDFAGQVALVTGASRGIGAAIAEDLASHGASIVLAARSEDQIAARQADLRSRGVDALAVAMDVGDTGSVDAAVDAALEHYGRIDILVNNAGVTRDGLFLRMKESDWEVVLRTNLDGAFRVTRATVPHMFRQRYGRIINISSVVGQMGNPGQANYVASKAGLIGMTKALAREIGSRGITVNAVAPGFVETDMTRDMPELARKKLLETVAVRRAGSVEDIAFGVRFLASKEAGYITGHVLNINGGMYM